MAAEIELDDYDFSLPPERIAQHPPAERDGGRLMALQRTTGALGHHAVRDLPALLREGDLLVVNRTRVVAARLRGQKQTGGRAEALLLGAGGGDGRYRALLRHAGRLRVGAKYRLGRPALDAELVALLGDGIAELAFETGVDPFASGETPLPRYIQRDAASPDDVVRYQTTFAREPGSVAAPTAGLHLSEALLESLSARGVERAEVVLHVGLGTFRPLRDEDLRAGVLHEEHFELPEATVDAVARTRRRGGRIVAVGTTTTRVLEGCADAHGALRPDRGATNLFIRPGFRFRVIDALLTNFHLPRSSLLLLVAAFAGREAVLAAYAEAVRCGYRFYSYGDAMLVQDDT